MNLGARCTKQSELAALTVTGWWKAFIYGIDTKKNKKSLGGWKGPKTPFI